MRFLRIFLDWVRSEDFSPQRSGLKRFFKPLDPPLPPLKSRGDLWSPEKFREADCSVDLIDREQSSSNEVSRSADFFSQQ